MILIETPLAGKAGRKTGFASGYMDLTSSQFDKLLYYQNYHHLIIVLSQQQINELKSYNLYWYNAAVLGDKIVIHLIGVEKKVLMYRPTGFLMM